MPEGSEWKRLCSWKDCVRPNTGDESGSWWSCFHVMLVDCLSSPVVDDDLTLFLAPKGCPGTLKVAFDGLEKRLVAMEDMGTKSSSVAEPSEAMSSSKNGLFLFNFSVNSGSMVERVRSCQPFWALKLAKARQSWRFRATCKKFHQSPCAHEKVEAGGLATFAISTLRITFSAT